MRGTVHERRLYVVNKIWNPDESLPIRDASSMESRAAADVLVDRAISAHQGEKGNEMPPRAQEWS